MTKKKFEVGDKVKVKQNLKGEEHYGGVYFAPEMEKYKGKEYTIIDVNRRGIIDESNYYTLDLNSTGQLDGENIEWNFSEEMLTKVKEKTKTQTNLAEPFLSKEEITRFIEMMEQNNEHNNGKISQIIDGFTNNVDTINKSIEKIAKSMNQRTIYDDEIIENIKKRITEMPDKDLINTIKNETDNYIKKNYGSLPKKIEIKINSKPKKMEGLFHNKFEDILKIIQRGVPVMLTGPAGAGKNHTLEQVAEALDLPFYFTNAVTQEYKLTGFIDANGVYQETQFYKAFKDGGLFFLDEVDASCPEALIVLNSAIANGYFDFPNGKVKVNNNFRVACAGNTYGTGADMVYVGRNALDGATLDRFVTINFDYDKDIEKQLAYNDELYYFIEDLRKVINKNSLRYIVSMRATINATKLLEIDMDKKDILKNVIIKNMQIDDLNIIIDKINKNNEWANLLVSYVNARN